MYYKIATYTIDIIMKHYELSNRFFSFKAMRIQFSILFLIKTIILFSLLILVISPSAIGQKVIDQYFEKAEYLEKLDSLRIINNHVIEETGTLTELSTQLALLHYPQLKGHKIKIKYKESVNYPITASWSFWNIFKFKKNHTYVLLIKPGSFVDRLSLNQGVGVVGHEMAHCHR